MLQRKQAEPGLESAFAAIIEPGAGESAIVEQKLLPVAGNEADALRAVAIGLKTRSGRTDLCFADGRPEKVREFQISDYTWRVAGEFAFVSTDTGGLRQATLTGGTLVEAPGIRIRIPAAGAEARIVRVDYPGKTFWTDVPLPPGKAERLLAIGDPSPMTSYTAASIQPDGKGSRVVVTRGAGLLSRPDHRLYPGIQPGGWCAGFAARPPGGRADGLR